MIPSGGRWSRMAPLPYRDCREILAPWRSSSARRRVGRSRCSSMVGQFRFAASVSGSRSPLKSTSRGKPSSKIDVTTPGCSVPDDPRLFFVAMFDGASGEILGLGLRLALMMTKSTVCQRGLRARWHVCSADDWQHPWTALATATRTPRRAAPRLRGTLPRPSESSRVGGAEGARVGGTPLVR